MKPVRPDLPTRKVKLDIDSAASFTGEPEPVRRNHDVLADYRIVIRVQSREEILVSMLLAFPASVALRSCPRHRDIWDICWLSSTGTAIRGDLLQGKIRESGCRCSWIASAAEKAPTIVGSEAFAGEMRRFLLPEQVKHGLEKPLFVQHLATETARLLRTAVDLLEEPGL